MQDDRQIRHYISLPKYFVAGGNDFGRLGYSIKWSRTEISLVCSFVNKCSHCLVASLECGWFTELIELIKSEVDQNFFWRKCSCWVFENWANLCREMSEMYGRRGLMSPSLFRYPFLNVIRDVTSCLCAVYMNCDAQCVAVFFRQTGKAAFLDKSGEVSGNFVTTYWT